MVIYLTQAIALTKRKIASLPQLKAFEALCKQLCTHCYVKLLSVPMPISTSTHRALIIKTLALGTLSSLAFGIAWLVNPAAEHSYRLAGSAAIAQQVSPQLRQSFLAGPLAEPRDPLLPVIEVDRPLSPLELSAVANGIEQLNQTAQQQLAAGNEDQAFELWRRELRLRRLLGPVEEFNAISRVAELAWSNQRAVDVQLLTLRTREIWETVQATLGLEPETEEFAEIPADESAPARLLASGDAQSDLAVLGAIAQAFATLRDIDSTVDVYSQLIELAGQQGIDPTPQRQALAELHLAWFQFADAADIYLALLQTARTNGNQTQEVAYLQRLVYSYQQADSYANAARAQTDLLSLYQAQGEEEKLAELLLAIAQNYRRLNLPDNAIAYYRSAYSAAQRFDQFSFSAQVLKDLGALYQSLALTDEALGAYNLLVPVEQQAYNSYGVMNAYNSIGLLQRQQGNDFEALKAFERALVLADQLNIRQDYFIEQIESLTQPSS